MIRLAFFVFFGLLPACRADSLVIKTNYYSLTGATPFEIREDIAKKRPWKGDSDAFTSWRINWSFASTSSDSDCTLRSLDVKTEIVLTLPEWRSPAEASEEIKKRWNDYCEALLLHEDGHKRLALAASAEVKKRLREIKSARTCAALETMVSAEANKIIRNYQERDKTYDERTRHGRSQGAAFP